MSVSTLFGEGIASLKGPPGKIAGYYSGDALHPLWSECKQEVSGKRNDQRHGSIMDSDPNGPLPMMLFMALLMTLS